MNATAQTLLSPTLAIGESAIRQHDGLYSLNDLHKASGGNPAHRPNQFLRLEQTRALVAEISNAQIRAFEVRRGASGGTYACRELVIAYAAWISAAFHLKVIRVFLAASVPPPTFDPSASHSEAIQFAMDYVTKLERHAANPAKNPRPKWDEAEAHRLADGVVSAWMLRNNRWLLSFDLNGKPQLTMVPRDACVMTPEKMLSAINDPNGLYIAPETLFRFAQATLSRLEHCHRYQKAKAEGGKVPLRW